MPTHDKSRLAVFDKVNLNTWKHHWQPIVEMMPLIADIGLGEGKWDFTIFTYALRQTEGRQVITCIGACAHDPNEPQLEHKLTSFDPKQPGLGQLIELVTIHLSEWLEDLRNDHAGPREFDYLAIEVHSELGTTMHGRPHEVVSPIWVEELNLRGNVGFENQIERVTVSGKGMVLELAHSWLMNSIADPAESAQGSNPKPVEGIDNKYGVAIRRKLIEHFRREGTLDDLIGMYVEVDWRPRIRSASGRTLVHVCVETKTGHRPSGIPDGLRRDLTKKASQWLRETGLLLDTPPAGVMILSFYPGKTNQFNTVRLGHGDDPSMEFATSDEALAERTSQASHETTDVKPAPTRVPIQHQEPSTLRPESTLDEIFNETYDSIDPNGERARLWRGIGVDPDLLAKYKLENRRTIIHGIRDVKDPIVADLPPLIGPDNADEAFNDMACVFADFRTHCDFEILLLNDPERHSYLRTNPGEKMQTRNYHLAIQKRIDDPTAVRAAVPQSSFDQILGSADTDPTTALAPKATVLLDEGLAVGHFFPEHPESEESIRMITWELIDDTLSCDAFIEERAVENELDGETWRFVNLYRPRMQLVFHARVNMGQPLDAQDSQIVALLGKISNMIREPENGLLIVPAPGEQ